MASTYTDLVGPPPAATTFAFRRWYFDLLKARMAEAPVDRATTYHFDAVDGDDSTGDGSAASPWRTLVKAQQVHDDWTPDAGGLALLLRRGQVFRSNSGLNISKDHVTVAGYGDGARPQVSRFTLELPPGGGGWIQVSGTHYKRGPALTTIGWVRRQDASLAPPRRMTDAAGVTATMHSWWYDPVSLELHVNLGADPDSMAFEAVYANSDDGIVVSGDGCRIDGIRCDGWGVNPNNTTVQRYGIKTTVTAHDAVVISHCDAYYNGRHNMGHYAPAVNASGGMATFVNCRAGWTLADVSGETAFVGYTYDGATELIFHDCATADAHLPQSDRTHPRNAALKTHQAGGHPPHALILCWGFTVEASAHGFVRGAVLDGAPTAANLQDVRTFNVGERIEAVDGRGTGLRLSPSNAVTLNCDWRLRPTGALSGLSNAGVDPLNGWLINTRIHVDLSMNSAPYGAWGLYHGTASVADPKIWHCALRIVGAGATDVGFALETLLSDASHNGFPHGELINCLIQVGESGQGSALCFNADASRMRANAISTDTLTDGNDRQRYSPDIQYLAIGGEWRPSRQPVGDMFLAGRGSSVIRVEFDADWQPRDAAAPAIGPYEPGYAQMELAALQARLDTALAGMNAQMPAQTVASLLETAVDGVPYRSALEAMMAVLFGVATRSGDSVTFYRQDAATPKVTVTLGADAGERPIIALS